ncbi:CPBP family intramembrane glutamic endopeptidase [Dokdonia donghaensis]
MVGIFFVCGIESQIKQNVVSDFYLYFFKIVIISPIIETFLFQFLPLEFLKRILYRKFLILAICSFIFGIFHFFNDFLIQEFIVTFILGWVFNNSYLVVQQKRQNAFLSVVLIHLGYNLFVFTIQFININS